MKTLLHLVSSLSLLSSVNAAAKSQAHHDRDAETDASSCWNLSGDIDGTFTANCTSVVGLCTEGAIDTKPALLNGSMRFVATGLGGAPVGQASIVTPQAEPATTWSYSGELVITNGWGTLILSDVGVLDTVDRSFSEIDRVRGGTGLYEGATGTLFIFGSMRADGSGFDSEVRGRLCLPHDAPTRRRSSR